MAKDVKLEDQADLSCDNSGNENEQGEGLKSLKEWMKDVESLKLSKLTENYMTKMIENWSKFRISVHRAINEQENSILDCLARLRKEVQWLNQVKSGKNPDLNKMTSRLFKDCEEMKEKDCVFSLKQMLNQTTLVNDKMLDSFKCVFELIKEKISGLNDQFRSFCTMKEVLTSKTYFSFLQKTKHDQMEILSDEIITCHNEGHDLDFGAALGPVLTKGNNKFAIRIERNDKYQCFIGIGVCHPSIVKENGYRDSGPGKGSYIIRQESDTTQMLALNHAYEKEGSHRRPKNIDWGFGEGDTILVEMDFSKGIVSFVKYESEDECKYEMRVNMNEGPVCPYVVLHSKWDTVMIVNS